MTAEEMHAAVLALHEKIRREIHKRQRGVLWEKGVRGHDAARITIGKGSATINVTASYSGGLHSTWHSPRVVVYPNMPSYELEKKRIFRAKKGEYDIAGIAAQALLDVARSATAQGDAKEAEKRYEAAKKIVKQHNGDFTEAGTHLTVENVYPRSLEPRVQLHLPELSVEEACQLLAAARKITG